MSDRWIDHFARHLASTSSRRRFLRTAVAATIVSGISLRQTCAQVGPAGGCQSSDDCPDGQICEQGFCFFPACTDVGLACADHSECCDPYLCFGGVCAAGPQCALEGAGCGSDGDCCPGMICSGGVCAIYVPPPDNTGGGGGGENNPPPSNPGGGGAGGSPQTSSGAVVASLPNTGAGVAYGDRDFLGPRSRLMAIASAAGLGGIALRLRWRREQDPGD
jgi:hypothetical protein